MEKVACSWFVRIKKAYGKEKVVGTGGVVVAGKKSFNGGTSVWVITADNVRIFFELDPS